MLAIRTAEIRYSLLILKGIRFRWADFFAGGDDFVERGHGVAGADFAGIFFVVVKIFGGEHAVFVADQPIAGDLGRVELDLDLHILGNRDERAGHFLDEHLAGFGEAVDIVLVAVAFARDRFHHRVVEIAPAEAEHGEEDAGLGLLLGKAGEIVGVGDADVEIAVGAKDHAIRAPFDEIVECDLVSQVDSRAAGRAAAGLKAVERGEDRCLFVAAGALEGQAFA